MLYSNQKSTTQITSETGNATTSPRANVFCRTGEACSTPSGTSGMNVTPLIKINHFVPLDDAAVPLVREARNPPASSSRESVSGRRLFRLRRLRNLAAPMVQGPFRREALQIRISSRKKREGQGFDEGMELPSGVPVWRCVRGVTVGRSMVLLALCSFPGVAAAQEVKVLTPVEIFEEEAGPGVRIGSSFMLYGAAEGQILYDTNIYNTAALKRSDTLAIAKPTLVLKSDWARHYVQVTAGAEIRRYFKIDQENSEQYRLQANTMIDFGDRIALSTEAGIAERIEQRGTAGDAFATDKPIQYLEKKGSATLSRTGGTLELIGRFSFLRQDFENSTVADVPLDLSYRDAMVLHANLHVNYRINDNVKLYTEVDGNTVNYDQDAPVSRDSKGFAVFGGIQYQASSLVDVQVAMGFIQQYFDDPAVPTASGANYQIKANWTPAPQWKLTATGERAVYPSPFPNVPAIIRSTFELKVQRSMGDRLLLETRLSYGNENYKSITRSDNRYIAEAALRLRLTSQLGASVFAGYRKQTSDVLYEGYSGLGVGASLSFLI
ncbi:outer membrane beta-barrel protein [Novosphingobium album (ex Hu et al. 2023)]|uniref:Outer membrane beta-barrel protein n=1 Tax=Novosphingobium album (ex Hu et al. 2023) TaxID=2930093 RepID=A0ABT0B4K5_9SPHN|nr:outer membrane beta-barrel protein [Novosphingobium album (ex Hu et al. 2023)]MCJ2179808.1 outer membrane beta-barrel protein [Novosphingobium album (ex Hu et al. 2023)]